MLRGLLTCLPVRTLVKKICEPLCAGAREWCVHPWGVLRQEPCLLHSQPTISLLLSVPQRQFQIVGALVTGLERQCEISIGRPARYIEFAKSALSYTVDPHTRVACVLLHSREIEQQLGYDSTAWMGNVRDACSLQTMWLRATHTSHRCMLCFIVCLGLAYIAHMQPMLTHQATLLTLPHHARFSFHIRSALASELLRLFLRGFGAHAKNPVVHTALFEPFGAQVSEAARACISATVAQGMLPGSLARSSMCCI